MLSIVTSNFRRTVSTLIRSRSHLTRQSRAISILLDKIDDPERALDVALIDSYQGPEITYGHLSKESKRIADILESTLDPSVQSIGKKLHARCCYDL